MKIGIFGGSFNPIHNGHLLIAQQFIDLKIVDEVWLLPCFSHVWNKDLALPEHRVKMIELALVGAQRAAPVVKNKIFLSKLEIEQGKPMYTIDTVKLILKKYPKDNFFWIIGSDNFKTLNKWHSYEELLDLIPFIIVPRYDNYSSTIIRDHIKNNLPITNLVPKSVEKYIFDNKLYNEP